MIVSKNARKMVLSDSDREAVSNRQRSVRVPLRPLQTFLREVREELGLTEASVTIGLVSDAEIARMNEGFRNKKGATDVLSFPAVARRGPRRSGLAKRKRSAFAEIEKRLASPTVSSLDKWLAVTKAEERMAPRPVGASGRRALQNQIRGVFGRHRDFSRDGAALCEEKWADIFQ